jgi:hypothetical protein
MKIFPVHYTLLYSVSQKKKLQYSDPTHNLKGEQQNQINGFKFVNIHY